MSFRKKNVSIGERNGGGEEVRVRFYIVFSPFSRSEVGITRFD